MSATDGTCTSVLSTDPTPPWCCPWSAPTPRGVHGAVAISAFGPGCRGQRRTWHAPPSCL